MYPVAIHTFGCKLNQFESEAIADAFGKAGFPLIPWGQSLKWPGLLIINTCTVTSKADQKARRIIRKALRDNPDACVIITGCYANLDHKEIEALETEISEDGFTVDTADSRRFDGHRLFIAGGENGAAAKSALLKLPGYLLEAAANSPDAALPRLLEAWFCREEKASPFDFKPIDFSFHSRGYLKIQDGCDGNCTYCRTRLARGPSISLNRETALEQLLAFEAKGFAELMVTGVNLSQYNYSGCDLAGLLDYLLRNSSTIALRLSSLEPEAINGRLAAVLAHPRIRPHFHLSIQSGSEQILRKMGRGYTPQKAEEGAALLRAVKDNPFLACDIITGFPGEGEAEFTQTIDLCEKIHFAWIHAFPYSRRPGTGAYSFEDKVCEREVSRRIEVLTKLALRGRRDYAQAWLGRELSAVVEKGKTAQGQCRAVSENYLKLIVNFSGEPPPQGSCLRCTPVTLCEGADGEKPDAIAKAISVSPAHSFRNH